MAASAASGERGAFEDERLEQVGARLRVAEAAEAHLRLRHDRLRTGDERVERLGVILDNKNARVSLQQVIRELEEAEQPLHSPVVLNGDNFGLFVTAVLIGVGVLSLALAGPTIERPGSTTMARPDGRTASTSARALSRARAVSAARRCRSHAKLASAAPQPGEGGGSSNGDFPCAFTARPANE